METNITWSKFSGENQNKQQSHQPSTSAGVNVKTWVLIQTFFFNSTRLTGGLGPGVWSARIMLGSLYRKVDFLFQLVGGFNPSEKY